MTVDLSWVTSPILVIVNALAATRLAILVTRDAFPLGGLRLRFTDWANERWGPLQRSTGPLGAVAPASDAVKLNAYDGTAPLAYLVSCPWCVSMYLAPIVTVLASTGTWWLWAAVPLALSAVAGTVATLTD